MASRLYDDRFGFPASFELRSCAACGHRFLGTSFSDTELEHLYSLYYPRASFPPHEYRPLRERSGFVSWLDGERRSPCRHVPRGVRVLDIGCGFCETLGYYEGRGCDAYGVEADANVREVAQMHGFKVHIGVFDPQLYPPDFFDYVTMDQVIEHVTDPVATLRGVSRVLREGGGVILNTPYASGWGARLFGRRWINWHAPYHQHFFSDRSMEIAAEKAGLRVEKVQSVTSSEWLFYQWNHLFTFPDQEEPSPFWSPRGRRSPAVRLFYLATRLIHLAKLDHAATRFFDRLDLGDGRLYFLRKI